MIHPALVERALRLIESRGEPVAVDELARELFGNAVGPWGTMVERVLDADDRFERLDDGKYDLRRPERSEGLPSSGAKGPLLHTDAPSASTGPSLRSGRPGPPPAGLVVLAAGPKPWKDPIVAIGAARWCGERLETNEWLVLPAEPCRLPAYLAKFGVTTALVEEEGVAIERAVEALVDFVGDAPLAGLDVAVGAARLQYALRALGRPALANQLRELAVAESERPDLLRLARQAGLPAPSRLRPATLASLAAHLARQESTAAGPPNVLREEPDEYAASSALHATDWRHLLDARLLADMPDGPGVYLFRDAAGRLLYVGKATSLRGRLASYLRGNFPLLRQMPGLVEATAQIEHEEQPCELAARLREAELIAAEAPPYNVQRKVEPVLLWAELALDGDPSPDGKHVPRLTLDTAHHGEAVLTSASAVSAALAEARRGWWPARPTAADRPDPDAVAARFAAARAAFVRGTLAAPLTDALCADDLTHGLLVCAPERPPLRVRPTEPYDDDGWTRERVDAEWRRPVEPVPEPSEPGWVALLVDAGGLRAAVPIDEPELADVRCALRDATPTAPTTGAAGLAALSVLLAALRRGEPGLRVWPNRP